jgi:hypothetical protein
MRLTCQIAAVENGRGSGDSSPRHERGAQNDIPVWDAPPQFQCHSDARRAEESSIMRLTCQIAAVESGRGPGDSSPRQERGAQNGIPVWDAPPQSSCHSDARRAEESFMRLTCQIAAVENGRSAGDSSPRHERGAQHDIPA